MTFSTLANTSVPLIVLPYAPLSSNGATSSSGTTGSVTGPLTQPPSWWASNSKLTSLPFYQDYKSVADQINPNNEPNQPTTAFLFFISIMAVAMAAGYGVILFTGSALMGGVVAILITAVGASMTIISGWIVFTFILLAACIWFLAKFI